jgi:hypothetical protein
METLNFNKLLLKTAFSCMACDGDIDKREVKLIKQLQKENKTFGEIDLNSELDTLLLAINKDGHQFLRSYLNELHCYPKVFRITQKTSVRLRIHSTKSGNGGK